ncbi:MAG: sarcosine oxidase subunit gamma [Pseudomonadota bacterium]
MADLLARSPAQGLLPVTHGTTTLSEVVPEAITSLATLAGATQDLPPPNRTTTLGDAILLWSGRGQALALGPAPDPIPGVAMTDQSDAFAILRLGGPDADAVLARLTPLDLAIIEPGHTARSLLGHMATLFHRIDSETWNLLLFRSMAGHAVHEIETAMRRVAARTYLPGA